MSRLTFASWTLSSIGAVVAVVGVGVVPALGRNAESAVKRPVLVESPGCDRRSAERDGTGQGSPTRTVGGATDQTITVTVPRTAIVRLGPSGRVIAALTNTGCAPRPLDEIYVSTADGNLTRSTSFDVGRIAWIGNFMSPGVYQSQRR